MPTQTTVQRGPSFDRTVQDTLLNVNDVSGIVGAKTVTVQVSGNGAITVQVLRHPAMQAQNGAGNPPPANSPHWAPAESDDPFSGNISPGNGMVRDYGASGFSWWMVKLTSGANVTTFLSVPGDVL